MDGNSLSSLERRWHDPAFVLQWEADRRRSNRKSKRARCDESLLDHPLLSGIARSATAPADVPVRARALAEAAEWLAPREGEPLTARARRLDGESCTRADASGRSTFRPPDLIAKEGNEWTLAPVAHKARPEKLAKAKALYDLGLTAKAQRELGCGLLGGQVRCKNAHRFSTPYRCGHRYCLDCGPSTAQRLFAKHLTRVTAVANALLTRHPGYVIAKVDFIRRKTCGHRGKCNCAMPDAEYNRELNAFIRRMARAIERRFGISRDKYAMAVHDEIGGGNTNAHAHAVYVGPYIEFFPCFE